MTGDFCLPANEAMRLAALDDLAILDTAPDPAFDAIVELASSIFSAPMAAISLLDRDRQWFKAQVGLPVPELPRHSAFCNDTIAGRGALVVADALRDPRFTDNELVTGDLAIRFYAGIALALDGGPALGALCIFDTRPRAFSAEDMQQLSQLSRVANGLLRQHRDARAAAKHNYLFERASQIGKLGACEVDLRAGSLLWTAGMYDIHEIPHGTPVDLETALACYTPESRRRVRKAIQESTKSLTGYSFEGALMLPSGAKRWIRLRADVETRDGAVIKRFVMMQDITEQREMWERLRYLATRDPLTGLSNRDALRSGLVSALEERDASRLRTLLIVDLDGFKQVNDSFGHQTGDRCLAAFGHRLRKACRGADVVSRLGGDEFGVLLAPTSGIEEVEALARRLILEFRKPVHWRGQSFQLSASIGMASWRTDMAHEADEILAEADLALYAAKAAGKNTYRRFTPQMRRQAHERGETIINIGRALQAGELEVFYQPKVDMRSGGHVGFEALLRWRRPDGGIATPGSFSAALEDPELSRRIGDFVLQAVMDQACAWQSEGLAFGHVAVNFSASQFRHGSIVQALLDQLAERGLPVGTIEVEVTEGIFLNEETELVLQILREFKAQGMRIALDDFGTGFASLTHLRRFPVDTIKIDRSFVSRFLHHSEDNAIVQSILHLAAALNLEVVAEGIEREEEREVLAAFGCAVGQGYLFGPAMANDLARAWMLDRQDLAPAHEAREECLLAG